MSLVLWAYNLLTRAAEADDAALASSVLHRAGRELDGERLRRTLRDLAGDGDAALQALEAGLAYARGQQR